MKSLRVVLFVVLAAVPVLAHHGGAAYDAKTIVLTGTVKQFQFTNPHSWIQVDVKDDTGKVVEWSLEWGSPNSLAREAVAAAITIRQSPSALRNIGLSYLFAQPMKSDPQAPQGQIGDPGDAPRHVPSE